MTASGSACPRGATGRADLLRLLAVAARERVMLDLDASGWFGYKRQTEPTPRPISVHVPALVSITPTKATRPAREGPLQMLFLHAIVRRTARPLPPGETPPEPLAEDLGPLTDEGRPTAVARAPHQLRGPDPAGSADASTAAPARNPLDLDGLIRDLATQRLPRHLPRRRLQRWHADLVVILDFC